VDPISTIGQLGLSAFTVFFLFLLVLVLSSYIKLATVLGIVRIGFGVDSLPSTLITGGLALVLSFFVMWPTISSSCSSMDRVLGTEVVTDELRAKALNAGLLEWKQFVERHANPEDRQRFLEIANRGATAETIEQDDSWRVLAPAFLVSELKEAFATGLSLFLPFLVIDLLVASVLAALGSEHISSGLVSFPFKILLFVMVDGWAIITTNLVASYS
jgi:flagellar biosynthesis protein FliP